MTATARMTDDERRKVFWLLKKYSSYTAWEALALAYYLFADAFMLAYKLRTPDPNEPDQTSIDEWMAGHLKAVLDGRIGFEKGLPRLKSGDRSVWRRSRERSFASWGHFAKGCFQINFIQKIMDPNEYVFDWMKNKDAVVAAAKALEAERYGQESILERLSDQAAPMAPWNALATVHPVYRLPMNDPKHLNFPAVLPDIPAPIGTTVDTGDEVPVDGIYEPEWGESESVSPSGLFGKVRTAFVGKPSLIDAPSAGISPRREHLGCMNYFLANTSAPPYQDREQDQPMPVTWRLIWKDERYLDGVIPSEEPEYLAPAAAPAAEIARLRCEAGRPCPREGFWFTPARPNSRRAFQQGEVMPDVGGAYGSTIWQWDEQQ